MTMTTTSRTTQTPFSGWTDPRVQEAMNRSANETLIRPRQTDKEPIEAQPLTDREKQVLALVAEGNSNKVIGDFLSISERTVKSHLTYIMTKLRASDRTHAVVTAVRLGWLAI
jgi:DNA-binding NarL/FixJ family response regulator